MRRRKHKLIIFYKMQNGLAPLYLSSLLPSNVGDLSDYNHSQDARYLHCRTQLFSNSFIPSAIKDWNDLSIEDRNIPTIS